MSRDFVIEPLQKHHDRGAFDCGEPSLNLFLKERARQNSKSGLSKTFVAVLQGDMRVWGYYTIASGSISFVVIPEKLPKYPIPTVHLGRLAVDLAMQGNRLGERLLVDALDRTADLAESLGIFAIELFAISEKAKRFYQKYGFVALKDDEKHLYLPLKTLRDSALMP